MEEGKNLRSKGVMVEIIHVFDMVSLKLNKSRFGRKSGRQRFKLRKTVHEGEGSYGSRKI